MTEKEAIQQLAFDREMILFDALTGETIEPEMLKLFNEDNYKTYMADELAIKALEEIQQYRAIGTVEECREAVERQKPVRVEYEGFLSGDGFCNYRMARCPKCGEWRRDRDKDDNIYCPKCGSKLDWSEEE